MEPSIDWDSNELIPEFQKTYQDEEDRQVKHDQEVCINVHLSKEGVSLATFHEIFSLRNKHPYWHRDTKTDEDIIREEDIQIIRNWRSLDNTGPGKVLRTNYGFGLEDIEGWGSPKGLPWWKFKSSSRMKFIEHWELSHHTPDQAESFSWILDHVWKQIKKRKPQG